jgi:glycosyltransferase involved in cell wall biosynthesis
MHVVWIQERARPAGGAETYVREAAALLAGRGVRSTLLYDPNLETDPGYLAEFDGAFPLVDLPRQLREMAPDVVFLHQFSDVAVLRQLRGSAAPVLAFWHDHRRLCLRRHKVRALSGEPCSQRLGVACLACPGFIVRDSGPLGLALRSPRSVEAELEILRGFAGQVVLSAYMAAELRKHGFPQSAIHQVAPFVAPAPRITARRPRARFLFAGALTTGKGVDVLLEAMARCKFPSRLVVAGNGPQGPRFQSLAGKLGLGPRVEFLGHRSRVELEHLYRGATALVLPTRAPETFGLVGLEAMRWGTPVVASHVGAVPEWCLHEVVGLTVPPNDPDALAAVLDRLAVAPNLVRRLGHAGRERTRRVYRSDAHADALLRVSAALRWAVVA